MMPQLRTLPTRALLALVALLPTACTVVGRDYEAPTAELPAAWQDAPTAGLVAGEPVTAQWWQRLGDARLDALIERAVADGLDLRAALARVREARALRGAAAGERLPSLQGTASYEHREESENTPFGAFINETDITALGLGASWEPDLFGRVQRSIEAADAELEASAEDARAVLVAVVAETAAAYVDLRAFQARLAIAQRNVQLQQETLAVVQSRFDSGLVNERDVAQAATNVGTTRSRVPVLEAGVRLAQNRLAVLVGVPPGALAAELDAPQPIPTPPGEVAIGVPAELLRRRPDVRRAERRLAAEIARIGVAEGELYPRLTLAGTIGIASDGASHLLEGGSNLLGFGPSLRWNLFQGGRLRALVAAQEARAQQAEVAWEMAVLLALEETENALTAYVREQERRDALTSAAEQAERAVHAAQSQYREGLSDFQVVLDSERELAELQDQVAASSASITANLIQLYRALGGDFDSGAGLGLAAGTR